MKSKFIISALVLALTTSVGYAGGGKAHWGYEGHVGPAHWGDMAGAYHMCKQGKQQSPIDIKGAAKGQLAPIEISYKSSAKEIINNGHSIQINMNSGSSITVGGKTYKLLQFHFHSPSEHTINGKHADMVAHFVHQAADGQLGVIGVLFNKGKANKTMATLWKQMPKKVGHKAAIKTHINIAGLLPKNMEYYHYSGSLTTPPCSEGVDWMVLKTQGSVSAQQVSVFTDVFEKSIRPVQAQYGRKITVD